LTERITPVAEHVLDWFHITMRHRQLKPGGTLLLKFSHCFCRLRTALRWRPAGPDRTLPRVIMS
jgi:hypothetical protein